MSAAEISITNSYGTSFGVSYDAWDILLPINMEVLPYGPSGVPFPFQTDYYWLCVVGTIVGFICAMGIGANDVANSFATSVGSGTLTVLQAMIVAGIFEFAGAVGLGKGTTDTIKSKIVNPKFFTTRPDALMLGMMCSITASAVWLLVASALSFPVSTTHAIIGAIMGFALTMPDGSNAVNWGFSSKGFAYNLSAWAIAPGVSAVVAAAFFFTIRTFILRNANSFERTLKSFPLIVGVTVFIVIFLVINKAGNNAGWVQDLGGVWGVFGVSAGVGIVSAILAFFVFVPKMKEKYENLTEPVPMAAQSASTKDLEAGGEERVQESTDSSDNGDGDVANATVAVKTDSVMHLNDHVEVQSKKRNRFMRMMDEKNKKLHEIDSDRTAALQDNAEKFEYRTERAFGYLQVFTACAMSFAHGSNDVANAIGPVASIIGLYNTGGQVNSKAPVPYWILALGGVGIVVGLGTYGYRVMKALGVKLVKITPSRGSCIELAAAFVVTFGSYAKLPLSTTQVAVGAALGVGLLDGGNKGVDFLWLLRIFFGWVLTFVVAGGLSAALFALIYYAPSNNIPLTAQNCLGNSLIATTVGNVTSVSGNLLNGQILTSVVA